MIVGPGAIGCFLGAELGSSAAEVILLDHDSDRARRLAESGLEITDSAGTRRYRVPVTADPAVLGTAELILVCVKSHATACVGNTLAQFANPRRSVVMSLQNGLGNVERLRAALPEGSVHAVLVYVGCRLLEEGRVAVTTGRRLVVGQRPEAVATVMHDTFENTSLELEFVACLDRELWRKALVNAVINPFTALHHVPNGQLPHVDGVPAMAMRVLEEGCRVAAAVGYAFDPDELLADVWHTCQTTATNVSSMRQDLEAGRLTEIESINGAIVRVGQQHAIDAPINAELVAAIQQRTSQ